ncbi:hypothetical protein HYPSUDRAFT_90229 [Hypholoma sublateritium FD-334 SS-4]|uniref:MIT domain-containing protein n=1 Tax=Hypholoma sublateritium (strain FD-334 SS-4) TaxID=945553 RepID=A0A0D2PD49_HYPSF|nr:hypothetical protein HYPSUDRAFT_90229 [Hypholoma sublateritium FD-334 SS-4]
MGPAIENVLVVALGQARRAVELDTSGKDMTGAINAYARSLKLLNAAIASSIENSREERDVGDREKFEEVERLVAVRDSYRNRIEILCKACQVAPPAAAV